MRDMHGCLKSLIINFLEAKNNRKGPKSKFQSCAKEAPAIQLYIINFNYSQKMSKSDHTPVPALSRQQKIILEEWGRCPDPNAIADKLSIAPSTLQTHLRRIRLKAGVHRTVEAWMFFFQADARHTSKHSGNKRAGKHRSPIGLGM